MSNSSVFVTKWASNNTILAIVICINLYCVQIFCKTIFTKVHASQSSWLRNPRKHASASLDIIVSCTDILLHRSDSLLCVDFRSYFLLKSTAEFFTCYSIGGGRSGGNHHRGMFKQASRVDVKTLHISGYQDNG